MTCLPDVNVWIALAVGFHRHHSIARQWEEQLSDQSLAFCRITEMGVLRMLTNASVMDGIPLTPVEAWRLRDRIFGDPRVRMLREPQGFEAEWRKTSSKHKIGHNIWTDAYLVSLCASAGCTLVTLDKAVGKRKGCEVILLGTE